MATICNTAARCGPTRSAGRRPPGPRVAFRTAAKPDRRPALPRRAYDPCRAPRLRHPVAPHPRVGADNSRARSRRRCLLRACNVRPQGMAPPLRSLLLAAATLAGCGHAAVQPSPSSTEVDPGASTTTGSWQVLSSNSGAFSAVNGSYAVRLYCNVCTRCTCSLAAPGERQSEPGGGCELHWLRNQLCAPQRAFDIRCAA